MNVGQARVRLVMAGAACVAATLIAGCGSEYSSVITPVNPSGPASQVESYVVAVSSPSATAKGTASVIDYSGDSILAQATIGVGPRLFSLDSSGSTGYTLNSDGTIYTFPVSTKLQTKNVSYLTLPSGAEPVNFFTPASGLWISDQHNNQADVLTGSPLSVKYEIPLASQPVMAMSTTSVGQRDFIIEQGLDATDGTTVLDSNGYDCNSSPRTVNGNGIVESVEIASYTISSKLSLVPSYNSANTVDDYDAGLTTTSNVARCPVYGVQSTDGKRLFVLNRGSDTISVINSSTAALDDCYPYAGQDGRTVNCHPVLPLSTTAVINTGYEPTNPDTANLPTTAGPVYAEYNIATQQLVVANYDGGTVSIIDVSLDEYGNDSATFGTTYTVKVGKTSKPLPASVTVLYDGSAAYTANQGDGTANGTVSAINLTSHTLTKTLDVTGFPRTVVSTQNSEYSKVYAAAPNSPYLTIVNSATNVIDTSLLVSAGNIIDVRTTTQNGSSTNYQYTTRTPGFGQPCNLPPSQVTSDTLSACQALPGTSSGAD